MQSPLKHRCALDYSLSSSTCFAWIFGLDWGPHKTDVFLCSASQQPLPAHNYSRDIAEVKTFPGGSHSSSFFLKVGLSCFKGVGW